MYPSYPCFIHGMHLLAKTSENAFFIVASYSYLHQREGELVC